jgi:hypothetical protein
VESARRKRRRSGADRRIAIEFSRNLTGQAPAVVELHDLVRRVVWIDLTPPYTW